LADVQEGVEEVATEEHHEQESPDSGRALRRDRRHRKQERANSEDGNYELSCRCRVNRDHSFGEAGPVGQHPERLLSAVHPAVPHQYLLEVVNDPRQRKQPEFGEHWICGHSWKENVPSVDNCVDSMDAELTGHSPFSRLSRPGRTSRGIVLRGERVI